MHLTLKQHTARPAEKTMKAQQQRFDDFVLFFNELRPNEALEQTPPAEHYQPCKRQFPHDVSPLAYLECDVTRSVDSNGRTLFANQSVYLSEALRGQRIGLLEVDDNVWLVNFAGMDIGLFEPGDRSMTALTKPTSIARMAL